MHIPADTSAGTDALGLGFTIINVILVHIVVALALNLGSIHFTRKSRTDESRDVGSILEQRQFIQTTKSVHARQVNLSPVCIEITEDQVLHIVRIAGLQLVKLKVIPGIA